MYFLSKFNQPNFGFNFGVYEVKAKNEKILSGH